MFNLTDFSPSYEFPINEVPLKHVHIKYVQVKTVGLNTVQLSVSSDFRLSLVKVTLSACFAV